MANPSNTRPTHTEDASPCSIAEKNLLGSVAPSIRRMIVGCLLVWGYCMTSCLGLLQPPQPQVSTMSTPGQHNGLTAHSIRNGHNFMGLRAHPSRNGQSFTHTENRLPRGSDVRGYAKLQNKIGPFIKHSKISRPLKLSIYSNNSRLTKNFLKSSKTETRIGKDSMHLAELPSFSTQTNSPETSNSLDANLNLASNLHPIFLVYRHFRGLITNSDKLRSLRPESNILAINSYSRHSNYQRKQYKTSLLTGIKREKAGSKEKTRPGNIYSTIYPKSSLPTKDNFAKSGNELQQESEEEENLSSLIQQTVQKMQNRLDYLMSLRNDMNEFGKTQGKSNKIHEHFKNKLETPTTPVPAYLNRTSNLTLSVPTTATNISTPHHGSGKTNSSPVRQSDLSHEERDEQDGEMFEEEVMSAVVKAIARGKIPEDIYFWRNVSHLMDSSAYLSRTRRSSYRSRYLRRWRPSIRGATRNPTRNYSRAMSRLRTRFIISYNHVRPCRRRDRYYCMNGGSCVFVVALDIKTCRCPIGYTGVRCQYIDQEYILSLLSNNLVDTR